MSFWPQSPSQTSLLVCLVRMAVSGVWHLPHGGPTFSTEPAARCALASATTTSASIFATAASRLRRSVRSAAAIFKAASFACSAASRLRRSLLSVLRSAAVDFPAVSRRHVSSPRRSHAFDPKRNRMTGSCASAVTEVVDCAADSPAAPPPPTAANSSPASLRTRCSACVPRSSRAGRSVPAP